MPQKGKLPAEEKLRIVEMYLAGKVGCAEASRCHMHGHSPSVADQQVLPIYIG